MAKSSGKRVKSLYGDWGRAHSTLGRIHRTAAKMIDSAVEPEAQEAAELVRKNLETGGSIGGVPWKPLSVLTIAMGGRGSPLQGNGELAGAVEAKRLGTGKHVVGIPHSATSRSGVPLAMIGAVHEEGATIQIRWTLPRMRAFWAMVSKGLGGRGRRDDRYVKDRSRKGLGSSTIQIPARPWLRPVLDKLRADKRKLMNRMADRFQRDVMH